MTRCPACSGRRHIRARACLVCFGTGSEPAPASARSISLRLGAAAEVHLREITAMQQPDVYLAAYIALQTARVHLLAETGADQGRERYGIVVATVAAIMDCGRSPGAFIGAIGRHLDAGEHARLLALVQSLHTAQRYGARFTELPC